MAHPPIEARCTCGSLVVALDHVTDKRFLCCCKDCQRRTGSPLSVSWYYSPEEARHVAGDYGTFTRTGTMGTTYHFHYCTACGSNVFWTVEGSGNIGVAAGCVPPEHNAPPVKAVWVPSKPDWVPLPTDIDWHAQGLSSEVIRAAD